MNVDTGKDTEISPWMISHSSTDTQFAYLAGIRVCPIVRCRSFDPNVSVGLCPQEERLPFDSGREPRGSRQAKQEGVLACLDRDPLLISKLFSSMTLVSGFAKVRRRSLNVSKKHVRIWATLVSRLFVRQS